METRDKKGIVVYLLIAFGGAWLIWITAWRLGVPATSPQFQLVAIPSGFVPALAAIIVRRWITREGFTDAGLRPRLRNNWPYYFFAWLYSLIVVGILIVLVAALGVSHPDFTLQRFVRVYLPGVNAPALPSAAWIFIIVELLMGSVIFAPVSWGEECGWRGYLQMRLFRQQPLLAAICTGIVWGVWHYPIILMGYEHYENVYLGLLIFPVVTVLLSIIFGWLRLKTDSVWPSSLAHSATNVIGGNMSLLLFLGGPNYFLVSYLGMLGWLPLGAICAWIIFTGKLKLAATTSSLVESSMPQRNHAPSSVMEE